ncbi:hypothetical protein SUDANB176_04047 [Streptomyces sp. enrichment culture]
MDEPRRLGFDSATGKMAYALTQPGSALDRACDLTALETATLWFSLADAMAQAPEPLSADEANFVLRHVVESLGEMIQMAVRAVGDEPSPVWGTSGRDIGTALRDMRP